MNKNKDLHLFSTGTCFIRTDQLDGETDWKLRIAVGACQRLEDDAVSLTFSLSTQLFAYKSVTFSTKRSLTIF